MFLPGISFQAIRPADTGLSTRADVAMFVGCVARRPVPVPDTLRTMLEEGGWSPAGLFRVGPERMEALLDVPVPVESWSEFDSLFAWEQRPAAPGSGDMLPTALGLAVRSFFEEGGIKAYVVRTGDPPPLVDPSRKPAEFALDKMRLLSWAGNGAKPDDADKRVPILPGFRSLGRNADPADPRTWSGAAAIYAVDDVALLVLPDLIDICAGGPAPADRKDEPPGPLEQFRPCAPPAPDLAPLKRAARPEYRAPRMNRAGYALWGGALRHVLDLLGLPKGPAHRRDVMLVSAFPLPLAEAGFEGREVRPLDIIGMEDMPAKKLTLADSDAIGSARLQLAYPWIETASSVDLPEGLQSPEGLLAGMIARTALLDGAFRSAAGRQCLSPRRLQPDLAESDLVQELAGKADWLGDRLCLIGRKRGRIELLSDTTMASDPQWRAGGVSRLMGIILRAARGFGDDLMFEPSGPRLWGRIRGTIETFMDGLMERGALDGRSPDLAYDVVCDETSMTQADIDSGRVICRIGFTAAYPIQHIQVSLLVLEPSPGAAREAA